MFEEYVREVVKLVRSQVARLDQGSLTDASLDNCRINKITFDELYGYAGGYLQRQIDFTPERATALFMANPALLQETLSCRDQTLDDIIKHTLTTHYLKPVVAELRQLVLAQYVYFNFQETKAVFDTLPGLWEIVRREEPRSLRPDTMALDVFVQNFMGPAPEEDTAELDGGNGTLHITIKDIERWIKVLGTKHRPEAKLAARQLKEINQGLEFLRDGSLDIEAFRNQARGLSI